jgi:hypothetical protein
MDNTDYIQKRSFLMANVENILENISSRRESKKNESDSLFGSSDEDKSCKINFKTQYNNLSKFEALMMEKEALGLYVSGNPLNEFEPLLEFCRNVVDDPTIYFVLIEKIKKVFTKAGAMMLVMNITLPNQSLEGVIFSKKAIELSSIVSEKKIFIVKGKIQEPKNKKVENLEGDDSVEVEEIKEFVELTKLIFDMVVPFESGILSLLERAELPISNTRKEIIEKLDWSQLLFYPDKFDEMIKDVNIIKKIAPKTQNDETVTIKISSNLGIDKAKEIKSNLSKTPQHNYIRAIIKVEHGGSWKTMPNDFWVEKGYYETVKELVK